MQREEKKMGYGGRGGGRGKKSQKGEEGRRTKGERKIVKDKIKMKIVAENVDVEEKEEG